MLFNTSSDSYKKCTAAPQEVTDTAFKWLSHRCLSQQDNFRKKKEKENPLQIPWFSSQSIYLFFYICSRHEYAHKSLSPKIMSYSSLCIIKSRRAKIALCENKITHFLNKKKKNKTKKKRNFYPKMKNSWAEASNVPNSPFLVYKSYNSTQIIGTLI